MDAKFWEEVERARRMTPSEKISEGLRLRAEWYAQLLIDIKKEFGLSDEDAKQARDYRMAEMTRRRSLEKLQVLNAIEAENAARRRNAPQT